MKKRLVVMMLLAGSALFAETHFSVGIGVGGPAYYPPPPAFDNGDWGNGYWAPPDYGYAAPAPYYAEPGYGAYGYGAYGYGGYGDDRNYGRDWDDDDGGWGHGHGWGHEWHGEHEHGRGFASRHGR